MVRWGGVSSPQCQPVCDDLDVHSEAAVLGRVVGAAVTDPEALGEGSVEQHEVRVCLAQHLVLTAPSPFGPAAHFRSCALGEACRSGQEARGQLYTLSSAMDHQLLATSPVLTTLM